MTATLPAASGASSLVVETSREGPVVVVTVRGDVSLATTPLLRAVLDGVHATGPSRVEIDLSGVALVDSHALTTLSATRGRLATAGTALLLRGPSPTVLRMLATAGLDGAVELSTPDGERQVAVR